MKTLVLKPGRERSVQRHHPWIFSGAIDRVEGNPGLGDTIRVLSARHEPLGFAAYSPFSQIRARMWTFDPGESVDEAFFRRRLEHALDIRRALKIQDETDAFRLVYAESDGIPGLIADWYSEWLVVQFLSAGVEHWRETLTGLLVELTGLSNAFERSDVDVRKLEGLDDRLGVIQGEPPPERLMVAEHGLKYWVDLAQGHKTGFYLDQRPNRKRLGELAQGREVLNCFSYTGGFSLNALAGGAASVFSVDSSADALAMGAENVLLNGFDPGKAGWLEGDVFQVLRQFRDQARGFDVIVLDPPKFAQTAAQVERAARGYKDINLLAFKLLRPGGLLFTFSCSGGVSPELFGKIVAGAALDAGGRVSVVETLTQGPDHPVALNFPEGLYLKGLVCYKE